MKVNQTSPTKLSPIQTLVIMTLWMPVLVGCGSRNSLQTEYGKIRNEGTSASLNGTRVLAEMFRQSGAKVSRQGSISPKLNRYQTIVWFPDRATPPSDEVVDALEKWIEQDWGRTLIYVGRDFDCNLSYLQQVRDSADLGDQEELYRQIAEALVARRAPSRDFMEKPDRDRCDWFRVKNSNRQNVQPLSGSWTASVDSEACAVSPGAVNLIPPGRIAEPEQSVLLNADGQPFVFRLQRPERDGQIIVVRNGSFLLNFALVNREHRALAKKLIDECDLSGAVVFLESGPGEVRIQDRVDAHQPWAWISRPPLRYIVPHLLVWGVLFCFVLYPIFGRAKRFQPLKQGTVPKPLGSITQSDSLSIHNQTTTTSFRAHLVALAKMLQRSEQPAAAKQKIQNYLETYGKDSKNR